LQKKLSIIKYSNTQVFKIRKYIKGDELSILKLDRFVETHKWNRRNLKNWFWKYKGKNSSGKSKVYVCEYKKKIIATFATIPLEYIFNKKKVTFSNSIAMIVHPKYQDKGIIKYLGDKLLSDTQSSSKLVFGYPNERSYRLHKIFFDYQDCFKQKLFELNVKRNQLKNDSNFISLKKINKFSSGHSKIFKKNIAKFKIQKIRDSSYLNWRYIDRPDIEYLCHNVYLKNKFLGYVIFKLYQNEKNLYGHIIDFYLDTKSQSIYDETIMASTYFLTKLKVDYVSCWCNGDLLFAKSLKKINFKVVSSRPFICKIFDKKYKKKITPKDWFFTMGDSLEVY
tara:strand:- start:32628 stop:33638 length:1011 start_codon:yes stop_codon:yes gene_type:complete